MSYHAQLAPAISLDFAPLALLYPAAKIDRLASTSAELSDGRPGIAASLLPLRSKIVAGVHRRGVTFGMEKQRWWVAVGSVGLYLFYFVRNRKNRVLVGLKGEMELLF